MADTNNTTLVAKLTNIANGFRTSRSLTQTLSLDEMATLAAVPIGSTDNKLALLVDRTITEITAEDLDGATKIGTSAFGYCHDLVNITIPNSITSIGASAFANCSGLTSLTIPASVTGIAGASLTIGSSTNKATITLLRTTPPTLGPNAFNANYLNKIIVPAGSGNAYKTETNWSAWADYIEEATA